MDRDGIGTQRQNGVVTGASSGIGAATARILAVEGADVVICYYRNREGAEKTADEVKRQGRRAWIHRVDLGDPEDVAQEMRNIAAKLTALDVVVLCAGENTIVPFDELTTEEWSRIVNVNLKVT